MWWSGRRRADGGLRLGGAIVLIAFAAACPKRAPAVPEPRPPVARPAPAPASIEPPTPAVVPPPETPAPRMLPNPNEASRPADLDASIDRGESLVAQLAERSLTAAQDDERAAGLSFLEQAKAAKQSGDRDRATVLAEKSLVILESLERSTR